MRRLSSGRTIVSVALVLVGDVLALISYFSPWFRLSLSGGDNPGERSYTLAMILNPGGQSNEALLIGLFVPIAIMVSCSVAFLAVPASAARGIFGVAAGKTATLSLVFAILFLAGAPDGLALSYPYYDFRRLDFGAWFALAGFSCVALGMFGLLTVQPSPTTS